ncbi:MAG TPA: hypothetical protein VE404_10085 [Verrucomicrobiae bacterium]|nr:hypothetical protein [Verrucomicrobiae bacterium]
MLGSHILTLILFAGLVSLFFATLSRDTLREGTRLGSVMFASMVGVSLLIAYLMYFFPLG